MWAISHEVDQQGGHRSVSTAYIVFKGPNVATAPVHLYLSNTHYHVSVDAVLRWFTSGVGVMVSSD